MESVPQEALERMERDFMRQLGDGRGRSYAERQAIALNYLRCIVERQIRQAERDMGRRTAKG